MVRASTIESIEVAESGMGALEKFGGDKSAITMAVSRIIGSEAGPGMLGAVGEIVRESEHWAPVCIGAVALIGVVLKAVERGEENKAARQALAARLVALGRTLLAIRSTFAHRPPPQMAGLLRTLQRAVEFFAVLDSRNWAMRAIKSSSDQATLRFLEADITAYATDMALSIQVVSYQDEHMVLRDVVQRLETLQTCSSFLVGGAAAAIAA
eukprot:CAMPEP_0113680564 /NCGR_PEP_ID=MMETSP0038_2-20120614/11405_1 /TAXON_ID=2898 /ORGANISM="Cryptomonas paramecium" /LENGTH=210 /DNA_ID=CAMNT_0000598991 /DNA_START=920 /DNA_END=1548 /DNA_ORIENTATION=- /assembly_acc=CAM_ASM_000170